ncbi:streptogrisin C [Actinopolyspora xinjiangensis]|uniref:Streptogrisin C n=1 Tax=Actinopolyspora xinjiangensis TaxID=405564 RepID=A0A1H0P9P9_9ACTN|nr:S1 family peptidase [Actinopolyspora xinjiangensis]SDP01753.1 streptogrisin C [Actinopolyspora xinjiangensis]
MKLGIACRLVGTLLLATATAATAASASSASVPDTPERPDGAASLLEAMQRDLGLSARESRLRLYRETIAEQVRHTLRRTLGNSYGGAHYDAASGRLVVGVTDHSRLADARAAGAHARLVEYSSRRLAGIAERLGQSLRSAPDGVTGSYVDTADNSVVLTAEHGSAVAARKYVRSTGVAADAVRVVETERTPRLYADVIGGNPYYIGGNTRCSVGFAVQGGFLSAGHCVATGDSTSDPAGRAEGSSFPGNDFSYIRSSARGRPLVNDYAGGTVDIAGSTEAPVGASVCRSGATTGWHCGTILGKRQSVRYPSGVVAGLTRTDVCAESGDSGGSFVSGQQAQGITSGGWGDCTDGGITFFQPVNEALDHYDVELLTG